jgi:hypothetical protein
MFGLLADIKPKKNKMQILMIIDCIFFTMFNSDKFTVSMWLERISEELGWYYS